MELLRLARMPHSLFLIKTGRYVYVLSLSLSLSLPSWRSFDFARGQSPASYVPYWLTTPVLKHNAVLEHGHEIIFVTNIHSEATCCFRTSRPEIHCYGLPYCSLRERFKKAFRL